MFLLLPHDFFECNVTLHGLIRALYAAHSYAAALYTL